MRASLSAKQTAAVTALIATAMTVLSVQHLANVAHIGLEDNRRTGELLERVIYQRCREAIAVTTDPYQVVRTDQGIRSILESTATYGRNVTYAAIVDNHDVAIAHSFRTLEGQRLEPQDSLSVMLDRDMFAQIRAIYADRTLEIVRPLQLGEVPFGAIRIGLSPVLIRNDLRHARGPMLWTTLLISCASIVIGLVLARRVLRPIHVISSGLMRLRRGEADVTIDLPPDMELRDVGESFKAIGDRLAAGSQAVLSDQQVTMEYARKLASLGRLMVGVAHEVKNPLNAMTIHLELVRQHLLRVPEAREFAAVAPEPVQVRGSSGAAAKSAEQLTFRADVEGAREHIEVVAEEIRRLDGVIQGFLRFIRPEELQLRPVPAKTLIADVLALVEPDVGRSNIVCRADFPDSVPDVRADPALLRQALLNLALNGCQAMTDGGILTIGARTGGDGRVMLTVEDTGIGIPADQLGRVFDLYYTTKAGGSGIGLSMVYRIVQLHGGDVEAESTVGRGTSFRILLPRA